MTFSWAVKSLRRRRSPTGASTLYYVYELIDPRDGEPFYVGKGKGSRVHQHERDAAKGIEGPKCDRIREIVASGFAVKHRIVARFADEEAAYAFEADHIDDIGIYNLTNIALGGGSPNAKGSVVEDIRMGRALWKIGVKTRNFTHFPKRYLGYVVPTLPACAVIKFGLMLDKIIARRGLDWANKHCGPIVVRASNA